MTNLPEQAHQRGTAVATRDAVADDPYALTSDDVTLPRLRIAQYSSDSFKMKLADYGDLVVGIGKADPEAVVVAKGGEPLGEPLRFYVHRLIAGYNYRQDPADKRMTFGPLGGTFQQALAHTQGDPRRVFLKHDFVLTIPAYEDLPVRFLMTSSWGGSAAKWINTRIGIIMRQHQDDVAAGRAAVLGTAFQVQTRPTSNDKGDFAVAEVSFAKVSAKDRKNDEVLVASHAPLSGNRAVDDDESYTDATAVDDSNAPSLA